MSSPSSPELELPPSPGYSSSDGGTTGNSTSPTSASTNSPGGSPSASPAGACSNTAPYSADNGYVTNGKCWDNRAQDATKSHAAIEGIADAVYYNQLWKQPSEFKEHQFLHVQCNVSSSSVGSAVPLSASEEDGMKNEDRRSPNWSDSASNNHTLFMYPHADNIPM